MNVLGIIAEYNPFHNGHMFHLEKSKNITKADYTVAIISGNFTQRGDLSFLSKWEKAELAVKNGVDLVLELPFVFACNNASLFAYGAVNILKQLNCVTDISFGIESNQIKPLLKIANFMKFNDYSPNLSHEIQKFNSKGYSYAKSKMMAISDLLEIDYNRDFYTPNNILAIEYLKNLIESNCYNEDIENLLFSINPNFIERKDSDFNSDKLQGKFSSATSIRSNLISNPINFKFEDFLPTESATYLSSKITNENFIQDLVNSDVKYFSQIINSILTSSTDELSKIYSITEGFEYRIKSKIRISKNLNNLKENLKTKRYTQTRVSRILTHLLLGLTKNELEKIIVSEKKYARVLSFNSKGASLLRHIKKNDISSIPIITNINKESDYLRFSKLSISYDILSSDISNFLRNYDLEKNSDYVKKPFILK